MESKPCGFCPAMIRENYICIACGTQYSESAEPPARCEICADQRQSPPVDGQGWTTARELAEEHRNCIVEIEAGAFSISTKPVFAIGQHAYLIRSTSGNVLWDCISVIDPQTVEQVNELGGIHVIALSHPHFYASAVDWSAAFSGAPVYIHASDRQWILRPDPCFVAWRGKRRKIADGITLVHCGGHFDGSAVLHWSDGAGGRGVLFTSDTIHVCHDGRWLSFMYSYPNYIPLDEAAVLQIRDRVAREQFDRLYGAFGSSIQAGGHEAVNRSASRYITFLKGAKQ
jgi:glyoxylase-like metal-dependent hydrolase (beta-lactamase superfamily II)